MKRKILLASVVFLFVAMLATSITPVSAAEKVPVTFMPINVETTGGTMNTTPSGIMHVTGAERTATALLTINSVLYTGSIAIDLDYTVNPLQGRLTNHYHKIMITLPIQNGMTEEGSFEGVLTWSADLGAEPGTLNPATLDLHAILQGSGAFEGYKLHLIWEPGEPMFVDNSWALIP